MGSRHRWSSSVPIIPIGIITIIRIASIGRMVAGIAPPSPTGGRVGAAVSPREGKDGFMSRTRVVWLCLCTALLLPMAATAGPD